MRVEIFIYIATRSHVSFSKRRIKAIQIERMMHSQRERDSTREYTWLIDKISDIDRKVLTSVRHVRGDAVVYEMLSGQEPRIADRRSELRNAVERLSISGGSLRTPLSNLSRFSEIIAADAARQSDDPRARTPTDLNCKLISLLCSQPPSAYHLSPIRDAVARHMHLAVARARILPGISSNLKRAGVLTGVPGIRATFHSRGARGGRSSIIVKFCIESHRWD